MSADKESMGGHAAVPQRRPTEPPPSESPVSAPLSRLFERMMPYGDASAEPAPARLPLPPPSGPVSGATAPLNFRTASGPGFWIRSSSSQGAHVTLAGLGSGPCKVIRLSPTAAWFLPERGVEYASDQRVQVTVLAGDRELEPITADLVLPSFAGEASIYGLTFVDVPFRWAAQMIALLRDLVAQGGAHFAHRPTNTYEAITEPRRIRAIVRSLARVGGEGHIEGKVDAALRLASYDEAGGLLVWQGQVAEVTGRAFMDIAGHNSVYRLHFSALSAAGEGCTMTALPRRIERLQQREHRHGDVRGALEVSFHHPLWRGRRETRRAVRDVSFGGLCFVTALDDDLLFPGLVLPLLQVWDQRGEAVQLEGEVSSVTQIGGEAQARLTVVPCSWRDESRWNRLIAGMLYPSTMSGDERIEDVWNLYRDSGYFNLSGKVPAIFDPLKRSYARVDLQGVGVPGLFCHAVFPSERGVEGTVSMMKIYGRTWMLHQIAKRKGASRRILREVYTRAFEAAQFDADRGWVISYMDANVRWNQMSHFAFAQEHAASGKAAALPFRFLEISTSEALARSPDPPEVGPATHREIASLIGQIQRRHPACYASALDLSADQLDLSEVTRKWNQAGFLRERAILIARRHGAPVAAAIVECGETGANLFRLVDSMRFIALAAGADTCFPTLIEEARRWFLARNKEAFVYFREDESHGPGEAPYLRDLGEGRLWVIAATLVPEFIEHVFDVTSPAPPASERTR